MKEFIVAILKWLAGLFTRKPSATPSVPVQPPVPDALVIPHPEEPPDPSATVANTDMNKVLYKFFVTYEVPEKFWTFWQTVKFVLDPDYPVPAATSAQTMAMWLQPAFANAGIIAHELSHISYNILSDRERAEFDVAFDESLVGDALVMFLDKDNDYMNTSNIEGYAELFRYIGNEMPEDLKIYYPMLI